MSFLLPYSPDVVIATFTRWFELDLTLLNDYQSMILCIGANLYFFIFWFFIIYFSLKGFNRIYERLF